MKPYLPVSCDLVDSLEIIATRKNLAIIKTGNIQEQFLLTTRIFSWVTKEKVEFAVLGNKIMLRLDYIISIDGKTFENGCNL